MKTGNQPIAASTLAAIAGLALTTTSINASVIFVVDAMNDMNSTTRGGRSVSPYNGGNGGQTFDLSDGGDSAAGLSGTLTVTGTGWFEEQNLAPVGVLGAPPVTGTKPARNHLVFHGDYAGDVNGAPQVATWTASGYAPGTSVSVYIHYNHQGNFADAAPFTITGGTPGTLNMRTAAVGDLSLSDTVKSHNFELLGSGVADGSGQVQLVLDGTDSFAPIDAAAFVSNVVPEPSAAALLGLGGLALLRRRRK